MEQNADTGVPVVPMAENKQKSGNGLKIATAIACIVAVCGIGFAVYCLIENNNKTQEISNLKTQIEDSNNMIATLKTKKTETADSNDTIDIYKTFVEGMSKNFVNKTVTAVNDVKAFATITEDNKLEIHEFNLVDNPIIQQDSDVISVYHIKIGNGIANYFYYIKNTGEVYRVQIDEGVSHEIEKINDYHNIVSIIEVEHGGYYANLIDINGNVFEHY